jgi:hypothetical protein
MHMSNKVVTGYLLEGNKYTGYHRNYLKDQIIYLSKKKTYAVNQIPTGRFRYRFLQYVAGILIQSFIFMYSILYILK